MLALDSLDTWWQSLTDNGQTGASRPARGRPRVPAQEVS